jgi:inner membrane protein
MDPLTQGLLGSAAAQAFCGSKLPRTAWLIGLAAGMAADLDVLIRPPGDPLGGVTLHRHFTHALAFIPVGAVLVSLPFLFWKAYTGRRPWVLLAAVLAYATHGLLDACTSYGTLLWWPFSHARVAWDVIGIIDPVFTLVLLVGLVLSVTLRLRRLAVAALTIATLYLGLGLFQHQRVADIQRQLAAARGDEITHARVMPTPVNLILWRSVYIADGRIQADSIRMPFLGTPTVRAGTAVPQVTRATLAAELDLSPTLADAFTRFFWFADGFTAWDAAQPGVVGDMRYALRPDKFASLWGLVVPPDGGPAGVVFQHLERNRDGAVAGLWTALRGRDAAYRPLASFMQ